MDKKAKEKANRDITLSFRITTEAHERLKKKAKESYLTPYDYLRQQLYKLIDYQEEE